MSDILILLSHILLMEILTVPGFPVCFSILLCLLITVLNTALMFMKAGLSVNNHCAKATEMHLAKAVCLTEPLPKSSYLFFLPVSCVSVTRKPLLC